MGIANGSSDEISLNWFMAQLTSYLSLEIQGRSRGSCEDHCAHPAAACCQHPLAYPLRAGSLSLFFLQYCLPTNRDDVLQI